MKKSETALKPCPFCGSKAEMKIDTHIGGYRKYDYTPRCSITSCAGRITKKWGNELEAIAAWNTRENIGGKSCTKN